MNAHVVFAAYERTLYFSECLQSLKAQLEGDEAISMVIDGDRRNPSVASNIALFQEHFPGSPVYSHGKRVGSERNLIEALRIGFDESDKDLTFLVEDDLKFLPGYVKQSKILAEKVANDPQIATFSCFTRETISWTKKRFELEYDCVINQHNQCGTFIKRDAWKLLSGFFKDYLQVFNSEAYKGVNKLLRERYDIWTNCHSMDAYYSVLLGKHGLYRVSTAPSFLKHIGEYGTNCGPEQHANDQWHEIKLGHRLVEQPRLDKNYPGLQGQLIHSQGKDWVAKWVDLHHPDWPTEKRITEVDRLKYGEFCECFR